MLSKRKVSSYNKNLSQNLFLHIKEEHPNSSDVSLLSRQHYTMQIPDKTVKQNESNKSLLFAVIGITFAILIILTIIHLWQKFEDRKKEKNKLERHACACNENGNVQLPLDPVYNDIGVF